MSRVVCSRAIHGCCTLADKCTSGHAEIHNQNDDCIESLCTTVGVRAGCKPILKNTEVRKYIYD